jgi:hypothetical protein
MKKRLSPMGLTAPAAVIARRRIDPNVGYRTPPALPQRRALLRPSPPAPRPLWNRVPPGSLPLVRCVAASLCLLCALRRVPCVAVADSEGRRTGVNLCDHGVNLCDGFTPM